MRSCIITIDGVAGCGKSTLTSVLSKELNIPCFDSGSLYRVITYYFLNNIGMSFEEIIKKIESEVHIDKNGNLNKVAELGEEIWTGKVESMVSEFAKIPEVRNFANQLIRKSFTNQSLIMNGRDIGTKVFPDAQIKVFLKASLETRIKNWEKGKTNVDPEERQRVLDDLRTRDYEDTHREISPLRCPDGAMIFNLDDLDDLDRYDIVKVIADKYRIITGELGTVS